MRDRGRCSRRDKAGELTFPKPGAGRRATRQIDEKSLASRCSLKQLGRVFLAAQTGFTRPVIVAGNRKIAQTARLSCPSTQRLLL